MRQQNRELFTAVASSQVDFTQTARDASRDFLQDLITRIMTKAVVDLLEVIDVDQQTTQRIAIATGDGKLTLQDVREAPAIEQSGERVGNGQRFHAVQHRLQLLVASPQVRMRGLDPQCCKNASFQLLIVERFGQVVVRAD